MKEKGILLHISSLPSPYGIGSLGKEAYKFVDFLKETGENYWQVLPLGPTSYGDSPYQTFSAFAGNPYFIDLDILVDKGLLQISEIEEVKAESTKVDYKWLYDTRFEILRKAYKRFNKSQDFEDYVRNNEEWLTSFALFMALKNIYKEGNFKSFPVEYQDRYSASSLRFIEDNKEELDFYRFLQYEFYLEWQELKKYANERDVRIIGDMPIYVAYDSSDVYSNPKYFKLKPDLSMKKGAGVPPDYFSKTGQLWRNPVYRYDVMKKDHYSWWVKRFKKAFEMFDVVRIDHFRGFASYYQVSSKEKTAVNGKWVKGPGYSLFREVKKKLGNLDIIAEDLGFITPDVIKLLEDTKYPGMKVIEFGFDGSINNPHLPSNYKENSVCYTGTHDNAPLKEWIEKMPIKVRNNVCDYLKVDKRINNDDLIDELIKLALSSVSNITIIPLWDYMHLGSEARFNHPSVASGNWVWRLDKDYYKEELVNKIRKLDDNYGR